MKTRRHDYAISNAMVNQAIQAQDMAELNPNHAEKRYLQTRIRIIRRAGMANELAQLLG